jgi:hypothetical protein
MKKRQGALVLFCLCGQEVPFFSCGFLYDSIFPIIFFHPVTLAVQVVCVFVRKKDDFFLPNNLVGMVKGPTFAPAFQENNAAA